MVQSENTNNVILLLIDKVKYGEVIERYYIGQGWIRVKTNGRILDEINRLGMHANLKYRKLIHVQKKKQI